VAKSQLHPLNASQTSYTFPGSSEGSSQYDVETKFVKVLLL